MVSQDRTRRQFVRTVGIAGLLAAGSGQASAARTQRNFRAHLSGDGVVPPVDTDAQGQAMFRLNAAGDALHFALNVANIEDVIGAHIHNAPAGENGPIVAFLYGDPFAEAVSPDGRFVTGTITAADVIGLTGLDALLREMRAGNSYVQVHTLANPPGEIRGQIH